MATEIKMKKTVVAGETSTSKRRRENFSSKKKLWLIININIL